MKKKLMAKIGTYQKDGQTKNRYLQLGMMDENQYGPYIMLDATTDLAGVLQLQNLMIENPGTRVMVSLFDVQQQGQDQQPQQSAPQQQPSHQNNDAFDDAIPF